jgi:hypothetical protein
MQVVHRPARCRAEAVVVHRPARCRAEAVHVRGGRAVPTRASQV